MTTTEQRNTPATGDLALVLNFPSRPPPSRLRRTGPWVTGPAGVASFGKLLDMLTAAEPGRTAALYLDAENGLIVLPEGAYWCDAVSVQRVAAQIAATAAALSARGVLLGSSHPDPGGALLPNSRERRLTTHVSRRFKWGGQDRPRLVDHFIFGRQRVYSFFCGNCLGGPPGEVVSLAAWRAERGGRAARKSEPAGWPESDAATEK